MNGEVLNEHDAHQGAESKGEFLGMTGNSAWYLLGSSGASVLLVIVLWGILGRSLLLCLLLGLILCGLSVAYVFALKNNKPAHYDSDFLESALVEAGMMSKAFGPRGAPPCNPFRADRVTIEGDRHDVGSAPPTRAVLQRVTGRRELAASPTDAAGAACGVKTRAKQRTEEAATVPAAAYDRLQNELNATTELLEEALAEREEELQ